MAKVKYKKKVLNAARKKHSHFQGTAIRPSTDGFVETLGKGMRWYIQTVGKKKKQTLQLVYATWHDYHLELKGR